MQLLCLSLVV
ncbi:hypothetical protein VCBJG01_3084, partial [Vibrio cholerae BJG-01]